LETTLKTKNKEIKELETLLLEIQNDFTTLSKELHIQRKLNNSQREKFKKKIDELTQKANDLYMVKGTEELKHAKAIFNKLREESLNNI
jgi:cob(I)alamin adenosyltransferase